MMEVEEQLPTLLTMQIMRDRHGSPIKLGHESEERVEMMMPMMLMDKEGLCMHDTNTFVCKE